MATEQELLIKINTLANTVGLEQAAAGLEKMAVRAQGAGAATAKAGQQVSQAGQKGADGLNLMSVATATMQGNFNAAASAAVPLLEKSKAVGLSMTQLSLAGIALSAVVAGLKAMSEWANAAAQRISKIQMDNLTNKVNASAAAYEKLVEAMQKAVAERDATLAYNNSLVDSYTRQALAINELNKQKELSATTDETLRREIEAKYSSKAAEISGMSDVQKEANERKRSFEKEQEIDDAMEASKKRQAELLSEAKEGLKKSQNAISTVKNNTGFWSQMFGGQSMVNSYSGMAKDAGSLTDKSLEGAQAEEKRRKQLEAEKLEIQRLRNVSGVDARAGSISRSASDLATQTAASDRARANQEALRPALSDLDAELADFHSSDQQTVVSAIQGMKQQGKLTVEAVTEWTGYLRQIKDGLNRQRYQ
jgi:hypothetical protein